MSAIRLAIADLWTPRSAQETGDRRPKHVLTDA